MQRRRSEPHMVPPLALNGKRKAVQAVAGCDCDPGNWRKRSRTCIARSYPDCSPSAAVGRNQTSERRPGRGSRKSRCGGLPGRAQAALSREAGAGRDIACSHKAEGRTFKEHKAELPLHGR